MLALRHQEQAQTSSPSTFEQLVLPLWNDLYLRALRLERSSANARDLVQDTVERALRCFGQFRQGTNIRVWLFTIMFNLFIDRCRRRAHELSLDPLASCDLPAPEPEETQPWEEISAERLRAALARLDPPFRDVVDLHWTARCSYQEISERLGIPLGTVGTRLLRARQKLRTLLASPVAQA